MKKSIIILTVLASSLAVRAEDTNKKSDAQSAAAQVKPAEKFAKLDTNKDGSLDSTEFATGRKNPEKAGKLFATKDKNSDGKVSLEEYTAPHAKAGDAKKDGDTKKDGDAKAKKE